MNASPAELVDYYREFLTKHGDSHKGMDWPSQEAAEIRYGVMLDVMRGRPGSLLDLGAARGGCSTTSGAA